MLTSGWETNIKFAVIFNNPPMNSATSGVFSIPEACKMLFKMPEKAIKMAEKETRLKVPLGMEYVVHKNWYGCH